MLAVKNFFWLVKGIVRDALVRGKIINFSPSPSLCKVQIQMPLLKHDPAIILGDGEKISKFPTVLSSTLMFHSKIYTRIRMIVEHFVERVRTQTSLKSGELKNYFRLEFLHNFVRELFITSIKIFISTNPFQQPRWKFQLHSIMKVTIKMLSPQLFQLFLENIKN